MVQPITVNHGAGCDLIDLSGKFRDGVFNPFTATARNISGLNRARTSLQNSIFSGRITNLFSVLCVLDGNPFMPLRKVKEKELKI